MRTILLAYGVTAAVFLVLDFVWLGTMVNAYYKPRMGELLLEQPRLGVAVLFYAIYVVGVVAFGVLPALREGDWTRALWGGALFGFCAYATYDMTNLAVFGNKDLLSGTGTNPQYVKNNSLASTQVVFFF